MKFLMKSGNTMIRQATGSLTWTAVITFVLSLIWALPSSRAAEELKSKRDSNESIPDEQRELFRISFRLAKPAAAHMSHEKEAEENLKTLRQLGCKAELQQHEGHLDLKYECPDWRSITFKTEAEVDQWQTWLRKYQFSVVFNTPTDSVTEIVKYQLPQPRTFHIDDSRRREAHIALFKMLGCDVKMIAHQGHDDLSVQLTTWHELGVATHAEAHAWLDALKQLGFLTSHTH